MGKVTNAELDTTELEEGKPIVINGNWLSTEKLALISADEPTPDFVVATPAAILNATVPAPVQDENVNVRSDESAPVT